MEFTILKLKDIPFTLLDKYKEAFILPINTEANSAIYIKPTAELSNTQIKDMVTLIHMSRIAVVILDVGDLFIRAEDNWSPYGFHTFGERIILTKDGRRIAKTFRDYLIEVGLFREIINTPETLLFGMCHSGLVY